MNAQQLRDTAAALVAGDKGLLAMDESNPTCGEYNAAVEATPQVARPAA